MDSLISLLFRVTQMSWQGVQLWMALWLLFVFLLGWGLAWLTARFIVRCISRWFLFGPTDPLWTIIRSSCLVRPLTVVFLGLYWFLGIRILPLSAGMLSGLIVSVKILVYLGFSYLIWQSSGIILILIQQHLSKGRSRIDALLGPLISRLIHTIAIVFGVMSLAEILHFPVASLLTGLGIGGIAIAMAAKETVANVFGSMTILFDQPFQIGDLIKVGDVEGTVEEVGFRSTRVRTVYDSVVSLPNAHVMTAVIENMGARHVRRFKTQFHLNIKTSADQVEAFCGGVRELALAQSDIRAGDISVVISEMHPVHGIIIQLTCFLCLEDGMLELQRKHDFMSQVLGIANRLGIAWQSNNPE